MVRCEKLIRRYYLDIYLGTLLLEIIKLYSAGWVSQSTPQMKGRARTWNGASGFVLLQTPIQLSLFSLICRGWEYLQQWSPRVCSSATAPTNALVFWSWRSSKLTVLLLDLDEYDPKELSKLTMGTHHRVLTWHPVKTALLEHRDLTLPLGLWRGKHPVHPLWDLESGIYLDL